MSAAVLSSSALVETPSPVLIAEREADAARVDALIGTAFGPGRYAKTAERLRERARLERACSFTAFYGDELAGAVRLWRVEIGGAPALFLGPIAVSARRRRHGLATLLVERACTAAAGRGVGLVLLVGDRPVFEPMGFAPVPPGRVSLPGPVDPARVFWRELVPGACESVGGPVTAVR